jgi:hypothetical protein
MSDTPAMPPLAKPRECPTIRALKQAFESDHFKTQKNMRKRMFYLLGWLGHDPTHAPTVELITKLLMDHEE